VPLQRLLQPATRLPVLIKIPFATNKNVFMSAQQSNLSSAKYGYDVVVATSQVSINNTLLDLFYESVDPNTGENILAPVVTKYYGLDDNGNIYEMDEATVLSQTGNINPFDVNAWDGTGTMPSGVAAINKSYFYMGFKAQLGIDPNWDISVVPNIVDINPGTQSVTYNMLCSSFQLVQCTFGRHGIVNYLNVSQGDDAPWVFTSNVKLASINNDDNLPKAVKDQLNNLGGEFSVQKLLLDLDSAALESDPVISGIDSGSDIAAALRKDFLGEYFGALKSKGEAVLNYSITVPTGNASSLFITEVEMYADAYTDVNGQPVVNPSDELKDITTLNYLCSTNGHGLPVPAQFNWNWLDDNKTDVNNFDGIIAVNRSTFANYFASILTPLIENNCYLSHVTVTYDASKLITDFSMELNAGQPATLTVNPTGSRVLTWSYESDSSDQAGLNGACGKMTLNSKMDASVDFAGNEVTIIQHLVIYTKVEYASDTTDGNVIDTTITDVYAITATDDGKLLFARDNAKSSTVAIGETPTVNAFLNFFNGINGLTGDITKWLNSFVPTSFTDIPVSALQNFIFPGGKTFAFKTISFSDNQDLVAEIKYTDPH
jgi:hypothetical protein